MQAGGDCADSLGPRRLSGSGGTSTPRIFGRPGMDRYGMDRYGMDSYGYEKMEDFATKLFNSGASQIESTVYTMYCTPCTSDVQGVLHTLYTSPKYRVYSVQ